MSHVRAFNLLRETAQTLRSLANEKEVKTRFLQLLQAYIDEQIKYDPSSAEISIYIIKDGVRVIKFKDLARVAEEDEEVFKWLWSLLQM